MNQVCSCNLALTRGWERHSFFLGEELGEKKHLKNLSRFSSLSHSMSLSCPLQAAPYKRTQHRNFPRHPQNNSREKVAFQSESQKETV